MKIKKGTKWRHKADVYTFSIMGTIKYTKIEKVFLYDIKN